MARGRKIFQRVENTTMKDLSKEQKEVLYYLIDESLSVSEIAKIRNTGEKAVYKTIKKLKDKGLIKGVEKSTHIKGGGYSITPASDNKLYRYHGISFTIKILHSKEYYHNILKKRTRDELDNNTMMLHEDCIVVYLNKDFWGDSVNESVRLSLAYTDRFITMIENNYKLILRKVKRCDFKDFRGEVAKVGDPYARELNLSKEKLRVYDEFGTLRLIVDNSFKFDELECVSKKAVEDMKSIENKWLDMIKTDMLLSEAKEHIISLQASDKMLNEKLDDKLKYLIDVIGNMAVLQNNSQQQLQEIIKIMKEK